jgi:FkbM family methyltransferase
MSPTGWLGKWKARAASAIHLVGHGLRAGIEANRRLERIEKRLDSLEGRLRTAPCGIAVDSERILTKTYYGARLFLDAKDRLLTPRYVLERMAEHRVSELLDQELQPGNMFVDVGANVGYYTCAAGLKVGPEGKVFAFEADPRSCELLRDNIVLNDIAGWTSWANVAVTDGPGRIKLFQRARYHGNTSMIRVHPDDLQSFGDADEEFEVETNSLDALLANSGRALDWIKIDVEGAETLVLRGLGEVVRNNPGVRIVMEWSLWQITGSGSTPEEMLDLIAGLGLEPRMIEKDLARASLEDLKASPYTNLLLVRR